MVLPLLTAKRTSEGETLKVELSGAMTEASNLSALIGSVPAAIELNCRNVQRVNSSGLRQWIRFFNSLRESGVKLSFFECSPALVSCQNFVPNFLPVGEIRSLAVPFNCQSCHSDFSITFSIPDLRGRGLRVEGFPCPRCKGPLCLDEDEEIYFSFLKD